MTPAPVSLNSRPAPWALVESGVRPIVVTLVVALLIHVLPPLVPLQAMAAYLGVWRDRAEDTEAPQQEVIVPIELDMFDDDEPDPTSADDDGVPAPAEPDPGAAPEPLVVAPAPTQDVVPVPTAPKPVEKPPDKVEKPGEDPKPEEPPKEEAPKPKRRLESPFEAAGDNNVARAEHPNVNIYIAASELRKRDLAPLFGDLLQSVPEWQLLLGGTGLDPIQHFDHVLLSTPHMRKKGRWVVARVGYNVSDQKMRDAVDTAAKRSKGSWLTDYMLPVASIDNDTRRVVLIPEKHQLVVLPTEADKQIPNFQKVQSFPKKPTAGIYLDLVTPANAFKTAFAFPKSIERLTLRLSLPEDGSYLLEVEMLDADEEAAKKNATFLEDAIETNRRVPIPFLVKYWIGKPTFETDGEVIRMRATVTRVQVERIMKLVKVWLENREADKKEAAAKAKKGKKKAPTKAQKKAGRRGRVARPKTTADAKTPPASTGFLDGLRQRVEADTTP